jgi:hypothetical protein
MSLCEVCSGSAIEICNCGCTTRMCVKGHTWWIPVVRTHQFARGINPTCAKLIRK